MPLSRYARAGLVAFCSIALLGCGGSEAVSATTLEGSSAITELESYTMTYTSTCGENSWFTDAPVTVAVEGENVDVTGGSVPREVATVDRILELIETAEDDDAESVVADYGVHGEPRTISIVYSTGLDDRLCFEVSSFDASPARVGCQSGPFFPASSLDTEPPLIADSSVPEVADAIAGFLEGEEGAFWPQDGWRVLEVLPEDLVQLVHPGSSEMPGVAFMSVSWTSAGWTWDGASRPNDCELVSDVSAGENNHVAWELDPASEPLGPDTTTFTVVATEQACANGEDMGDRLNEPLFTIGDTAVLMLLTATPVGGESVECPGNPARRVEIALPEPLGQRAMQDARTTDLGRLSEVFADLIETTP